MGVIRVNYKQMEDIRKGICIGSGKEGRCFLIDSKTVLKLYHSFFRNIKLYFDNYVDSNIAFPKDLIYYDDTDLLAGYTMPYLYGNNILSGFKNDLNINELKYAYIKLKDLIKKYNDIYMDDLCLENIIYDGRTSNFKFENNKQTFRLIFNVLFSRIYRRKI